MEQQLFLGEECRNKVSQLFIENDWHKVLLVTGKQSYESSGAEKFICDCLAGVDVKTARFCGFSNNPNITDLRKGLALTCSIHPDVIVAIGGGSVLDMGKLIRFFMTHEGEILKGNYTETGKQIPLIAIPTTAGTGAEATYFAVLYDEEGKKHSIADESILPDYAVVYPPLTYGQTPYVTACSGFDALSQAIEAYWNKNASSESDGYAEKAIDLIALSLQDAVNNPTKESRDRMAEGAYWAGCAINITKTTAPHAFSYPFTSHYGIPHGHAVAIVFPALAEFNLNNGNIPEKKKERILGIFGGKEYEYSSIKQFVDSICLSLPKDKKYDISLLLDGISLERLANNPIEMSFEAARELLNKSLELLIDKI